MMKKILVCFLCRTMYVLMLSRTCCLLSTLLSIAFKDVVYLGFLDQQARAAPSGSPDNYSSFASIMDNLQPIRCLNILLLGKTGVGKSTGINGFANYLSFELLDEAKCSEPVCSIPSKFTMTDENLQEVEVVTGTDNNEDQQVGQSVTQMPKSYVFEYGNIQVRIIDTPGIGDTRGIEMDRTNMQNIMAHLLTLTRSTESSFC